MPRRRTSLWSRRIRREKKLLAGVSLVFLATLLVAAPFIAGVKGRVQGWWHAGGETAQMFDEAFGVVDALDGRPNDDQLIAAIQNRDMRGRELAIEYLGEGGYGDALPILEQIVRDTSEEPRFRVAALESILFIARWKGRALAEEYEGDGVLRETARIIREDENRILKRPSRVRRLIRLVK